jgi:hypothetical protein
MSVAARYAFIPKAQLAAVLTVLPILITKSARASVGQRTRALRVLATLVRKFRMSAVLSVTSCFRVVEILPILPPAHTNDGREFRKLILSSPPGKHSDIRLA